MKGAMPSAMKTSVRLRLFVTQMHSLQLKEPRLFKSPSKIEFCAPQSLISRIVGQAPSCVQLCRSQKVSCQVWVGARLQELLE